jgi:hypothetical protein
MKLTDMFEMVIKDQNFFLLSAEDNVLLTMSDDPICVPLEIKTHLHNLRAWADEAAAVGDFGKAQNYEDRAVEILPRVVELTNLHEFATRSVKHARIALTKAKCDRDFKLQGNLQLFIDKVAGRLAKGEVILKNKAVKDASIVKYDDAVTQTASGVEEGRAGAFWLIICYCSTYHITKSYFYTYICMVVSKCIHGFYSTMQDNCYTYVRACITL